MDLDQYVQYNEVALACEQMNREMSVRLNTNCSNKLLLSTAIKGHFQKDRENSKRLCSTPHIFECSHKFGLLSGPLPPTKLSR